MATQATDKLVVIDGMPSVEKLWNGRFRLEFFCTPSNKNEGWYGDSIDKWLPEFGTLQGADFTGEGWEALDGEVYPNMCLVGAEVPYIPPSESHLVKLAYETLTASWVEEKDEDTDYELNGLTRVTRTFVALPGAAYEKVVGTDTIEVDGTTLFLGSASIKKTDAKWELTEVWLEAGELSRTENFEDGRESITITTIGACPEAPVGYTPVNEKEDNNQGFPTCTITFYKDDSVISRSNDYVGSQLAEIVEVFNPTTEPTPTNGGILGKKVVSNVDGIPTTRYTFLKPSVLSRRITERNGGSVTGAIRTEVVEAFNETPATTISGVRIGEETSSVEGIPTVRYTYVAGSGQIRVSTRPAQASLAGTNYVTVESVGEEILPPGVLVESSDTNDDGFIRYVRTSLQGTIVGVKTTYKDVADVRVAGTVDLVSLSKTTGGISGTIAVADVTPPRTKSIAATVTIEITETPPDTISIAYDLGDTSCSVTSISMSENYRGTDVFETSSGSSRFSGQRKTADMSARIGTYPECYLSNLTTNSGTFSYTSSYENQSTNPDSIVAIGQVSTTNTFVDGTGSTSADYATTGVLKRSTRPILTAIDGTVYYEVITWEA